MLKRKLFQLANSTFQYHVRTNKFSGEVVLKITMQEIFAILQCVTASTGNLLLTSSPKSLVRINHLSEENIPKEWRPQVHCCQSFKSHMALQKHFRSQKWQSMRTNLTAGPHTVEWHCSLLLQLNKLCFEGWLLSWQTAIWHVRNAGTWRTQRKSLQTAV